MQRHTNCECAKKCKLQSGTDPYCCIALQALMLDITERYPKSGEVCKLKRRDLKKGKFDGRFMRNKQGDPVIECAFPPKCRQYRHCT